MNLSDEHLHRFSTALVEHGVDKAFGITGSGLSLRLIRALREQGVDYHCVGHEAAAALMAGGALKRDGIGAVSISIKGPGFVNMVPGLLSNFYEGRPMVSVSEAYNGDAPCHMAHKRLDHKSLCSNVAKGYGKVSTRGEDISRLLALAGSEYPGPVHFDLCKQVENSLSVFSREDFSGGACLHSDLARIKNENAEGPLFDMIGAARKPVVILGSLASRRAAAVNWNKLRVPVVSTAAAKGVFNEHSPLFGGIVTGEVSPYSPEENVLSQADLIVGIGLRNTEMVKVQAYGARLVIVDTIAGGHTGFGAIANLIVEQSADSVSFSALAEAIIGAVNTKSWGEDLIGDFWSKLDRIFHRDEWMHGPVFQAIQNLLEYKCPRQNAALVLDTGFFCTLGETYWKAADAEGFMGSSVGRFMGVAVPTAIGYALRHPDRPVVCVVGDGGIAPFVSEIKLAVDAKLPILFALFSDGRYGSVAAFSAGTGAVDFAVDMRRPHWWRAVEAMGCPASPVSDFNSLENAIQKWDMAIGPRFIECRFDPQRYAQTAKLLR